MSVNDPIGDMLTRIRNACMARKTVVDIPASKMKLSIAEILKREGFVKDYTLVEGKPYSTISITLKYMTDRRPAISGLRRVSKPGLRSIPGGMRSRVCVAVWA